MRIKDALLGPRRDSAAVTTYVQLRDGGGSGPDGEWTAGDEARFAAVERELGSGVTKALDRELRD